MTEATPQAKLIFDRFHVRHLAHNALDQTRREEVRKAATKDEKAALEAEAKDSGLEHLARISTWTGSSRTSAAA